jgi:hypothetical protein
MCESHKNIMKKMEFFLRSSLIFNLILFFFVESKELNYSDSSFLKKKSCHIFSDKMPSGLMSFFFTADFGRFLDQGQFFSVIFLKK